MRVLMVCLGNICRSPTAEAVLRHLAAQSGRALDVDSAGTAGWHEGNAPYPAMIAAAAKRGYDMQSLRARQFSVADFGRFDLIFAMDRQNCADIEALRPEGVTTPVRLLLQDADGPGEVPDPYYTRNFDQALDLIETGCRGFLESRAFPPKVQPPQ